MVLDDVAQQFEEREDVEDQNEAGEQQNEVKHEAGQHVGIDHLRQQRKAREPGAGPIRSSTRTPRCRRTPNRFDEGRSRRADHVEVARYFQARDHHHAEHREHASGSHTATSGFNVPCRASR